MFSIIVAVKELAETAAEYFAPGDEWAVEGDYGFHGSFKTQGAAWKFAQETADQINESRGAGTVEVQLNA